MGRPRVPALLYAGEAALNLGLSVVLGRRSGLTGVALATLVASAAATFLGVLPYACRLVGVAYERLLWTILRGHAPAGGAALLTGWALRAAADGIPRVLAVGVLVVAVYVAVLIATGLDRGERGRLRDRLRRAT
jgi:O-antigen/teichoic acid export membrane protein